MIPWSGYFHLRRLEADRDLNAGAFRYGEIL